MTAAAAKIEALPTPWNGWFNITDAIRGETPQTAERFLVWIPAPNSDWPGEEHIAWWDEEIVKIMGEWRHIADVSGLNETEPTHWQLLPGEPRGLV